MASIPGLLKILKIWALYYVVGSSRPRWRERKNCEFGQLYKFSILSPGERERGEGGGRGGCVSTQLIMGMAVDVEHDRIGVEESLRVC